MALPPPLQPSDPTAEPVDGAPDSNEFFYINSLGFKDDTKLHGPMLRAVDWPIDEAIMGPIREKYRAKRVLGDAFDPSKHPRVPKGSPQGGEFEHTGAVATAAQLYRPPTKTAEEIVNIVPGGMEAYVAASAKLKTVVETNKLVSEGGFKQPDGNYTPARQVIQDKIIEHFINEDIVRRCTPAQGENPVLTILGGRGGSGKSWLTSKDGPVDVSKAVVLDSDEIKSMLPEYKGWNAAQLHEESSDIVAMIDNAAAKLGLNVVLDGTLKSRNIEQRIAVYQAPLDSVYELEGYYMYASPETAATRAMKRFATNKGDFSGRFVPPAVVLGNTQNEKNFDEMSRGFRKWAVYDFDQGQSPRLYQKWDGKRVR